jgi:uncharacterized protein YbjT (DUF2867 family)
MKNENLKTLIVGASGTVGSEIVKILKAQGVNVKATTSKAAHTKAGVEYVHVNLATGEGLHVAFDGVDQAFLLSPPGYADHYQILAPLIQEAKRRSLKKVVLMTAMGANASEDTPFRTAEIALERSGLNYNIIRPNWFLQNFNTFWGAGIKSENKIALPAGDAVTSFIDTRDVATVAAKLLTSDEFNNQAFDLTGPEAVSHAQVAAALSSKLDKKISYEDIAPVTLQNTLLSWGLPADYVGFMVLIFGFLKAGYGAAVTNNVEIITGKKPKSLHTYIADYQRSWT